MKRLFFSFAASVVLLAMAIVTSCSENDVDSVSFATFEVTPSSLDMITGETEQLTVVTDLDISLDGLVKYSVLTTADATTYITVSNTGLVTAVAEGSAEVVVSSMDSEHTIRIPVTVTDEFIAVESVTIDGNYDDPDNKTISTYLDGSFSFTATVLPEDASVTDLEWSLDDVDSTGSTISTTDTGGCSFKAGSNVGVVVLSVTLTDSDDNSTVYSDKVTITIYGDSMEMSDPTLNLSLTETKEISVTISPENSDAVVVWTSSDESVVAVAADSEDNTKATVTVNGSGSATITAAYGTATATCDVMVDYLAVTSVVIDTPVSTTLNAGETIVLTSSVNENANPSVVWSIASGDTTASSIDATTGEFTAGAYKGDVTVVATSTADGSKFGELTLTVNVPVMDVSLNYNSYALSLTGTLNTIKLEAIFSNNPTNQNVTWSTGDLSVAMVVDGLVTAVASGSATITATTVDGAYTAICLITVVDGSVVAATKVVLNTTTASLILDSANSSTEALIATVQDASGSSATNQFVTWSSSNESVVTVDESGNVKATGAGSATITVTSGDGGYTATCAVTVSYATITAVAIDQDDNTVVGSAATLQLTYTPVSDGTFDPTTAAAVWSIISDTSGTGSTIDSSTGVFTAGVAAAGSVSVQVSYAGKTDTVTLDVEEKRDVTSIALDIDTLTLAVGSSYTFTVGVLPDNATYTEYTYSQSGTGSVSIEGDKITAVTAGTVTLTVTSDDPSVTVVDTCTITIKNGLDIDDLVDGGSFFN